MSKGAKDADRLTPDADTWPEQEIVSAWLSKYGILIPFKQQLDLQEQLTKLRQSLSQEAVRNEAYARGLRYALDVVLDTDEQSECGDELTMIADAIREELALKREPNAADEK